MQEKPYIYLANFTQTTVLRSISPVFTGVDCPSLFVMFNPDAAALQPHVATTTADQQSQQVSHFKETFRVVSTFTLNSNDFVIYFYRQTKTHWFILWQSSPHGNMAAV